jgi:hypothetical protein
VTPDRFDAVRNLMKQYQETKELTEIDVMYDEELARIADLLALALEEALR